MKHLQRTSRRCVGESAARKWFLKFKNGDFDIDNTPHGWRSFDFHEEYLKAFLNVKTCQTSRKFAKKINCYHKTILNHLYSMEFAEKSVTCLPHELMEKNTKIAFKLFLSISPTIEKFAVINGLFLYHIVKGEEKWCLYINMKIMICFWWNWEA